MSPHTFFGIHKSPSSSYGFRFKITSDRKENVFIRQLLLSALLPYSPWTKQNKNPQYLLSPCRKHAARNNANGYFKDYQSRHIYVLYRYHTLYLYRNDGTIPEQWHIIFKSFTNIIIESSPSFRATAVLSLSSCLNWVWFSLGPLQRHPWPPVALASNSASSLASASFLRSWRTLTGPTTYSPKIQSLKREDGVLSPMPTLV